MGEKREKKIDPLTRSPSRALAAGISMCHSSLVTRGGGGGGGLGGDLTVECITFGLHWSVF